MQLSLKSGNKRMESSTYLPLQYTFISGQPDCSQGKFLFYGRFPANKCSRNKRTKCHFVAKRHRATKTIMRGLWETVILGGCGWEWMTPGPADQCDVQKGTASHSVPGAVWQQGVHKPLARKSDLICSSL